MHATTALKAALANMEIFSFIQDSENLQSPEPEAKRHWVLMIAADHSLLSFLLLV